MKPVRDTANVLARMANSYTAFADSLRPEDINKRIEIADLIVMQAAALQAEAHQSRDDVIKVLSAHLES